MLTKEFKFLLKKVADDGTFTGLAAVYGNQDLGGDIIMPGAFAKTISDKQGEVPLLWQHDAREPIGLALLKDSAEGLVVDGNLVMQSPTAQKAYALMKAGVLKGLSIGYDTIVSEYDRENDIRRLKELRLWEVSTVTFPMNPRAQITDIKCIADDLSAAAHDLQAKAFAMHREIKAGRQLSAATVDKIRSAMTQMESAMAGLMALMTDAEAPKSAALPPDLLSIAERIGSLFPKRG